jgi:acylphosphatase
MTEELARLNLLVIGEVQGVFFRVSALEQAQSLNVTGWVRNLGDGSVEIEAEGRRYALEELLKWAQHGPPAARVEDVIVRWAHYEDEYRTFRIER